MKRSEPRHDVTAERGSDRTGYRKDHFVHLVVASCALLVFSFSGGCTGRNPTQTSDNNTTAVQQTSPSTPTSASLPLAVTAGGVTVTLGLVDSTSAATRFNFIVKLPAYDAGQVPSDILGASPAADVQIDGMTAVANDPRVTESDVAATPPQVGFSLTYQSAFPSAQTVDLSINELWLPPKSASPTAVQDSPQAIRGPWTFTITPAMVSTQPLPTPAGTVGGRFTDISVVEAEKLVSFPIIEPTPLPSVLTRKPFSVVAYQVGETGSSQANDVQLYYPPQPPSVQQGVLLIETSNSDLVFTTKDGQASRVGRDGNKQTHSIAPGSQTVVTIDGVNVTKFDVAAANTRTRYYVWHVAGINFEIEDMVITNQSATPLVTDADLQQMVTSILDQAI